MDTTTPEGGSTEVEQPTTTEAVTTESHSDDQVITTDDSGTPTMVPVTSQSESAEAAPSTEEAQAPEADDAVKSTEIVDWAKKKGLEINPDNPIEVKLAEMQREAERKMHQATQKSVQPPEFIPEDTVSDPIIQQIVQEQNETKVRLYVDNWFRANPELEPHRLELQKIANDRPYLQNMDDIKAHFLANPSREAQLKMDGGRQALTNLAQKQSQVPPGANATNSGVYASASVITPQNVNELVEKNDQAWFEKNHEAISKAMEAGYRK
jgi:hypothetical protein